MTALKSRIIRIAGMLAIVLRVTPVFANELPMRIAIIKADDVRKVHANWTQFFTVSKEKGIKVSAGIICNSLQGENKAYAEYVALRSKRP